MLTSGRDIHTSGSGEHSSSQVVDDGYQGVFLLLAKFCIKLTIKKPKTATKANSPHYEKRN